MILRPYQTDAVEAVYKNWDEYRKVLAVLPTGTGKTICFADIAKREHDAGRRTLILAHRDELIRQAADKIMRSTGLSCAIEKAEETSIGSMYRIVVGSVQTMMRQSRLQRFDPNYFDTIIVDECHHAISDSYRRVLDYFTGARVLGVTATPDRGDKRNLGAYFEALAYEYSLRDAVKDGWLCRIAALTVPLKIDLTGVRTTAGDYNEADLGNALYPYLPHIADQIPPNRKTMIFTPLCATAQKLQVILNSAGRRAYYASGDDRSQIPAWEADGPGAVMLNSQLFNEGYDHPPIDCIVVLRATKSRPYYAQMVGRGTRPFEGKKNLLLIDFLWHTVTHDLCHPCSLVAENEEVAAKMESIQESAGGELDLEDMEIRAKEDVIKAREEALAEKLRTMRNKQRRAIDPIAFGLSIDAADLADYEPLFAWEKRKPSDGQVKTLQNFGLATDEITTRGLASKLLERVIERRKQNLASPKQVSLLRRFGYGHEHAAKMNFNEAKHAIDKIADNGWRRPRPVEVIF